MVSTWIATALSFVGAVLVLVGEFLPDDKRVHKVRRRLFIVGGGALVAVVTVYTAVTGSQQQGRIEVLTGETRDLVTGGSSYVWIYLVPDPRDSSQLTGALVHSGGPIPAFDVTVLIENTGRCDELLPQTRDRALATGVGNVREQYFPAIVPRMVFRLAAQFRPSCDEAYYFAYITTRNRTMMQQTLLTKRADRWDQTMRLLDLQSGLELHSFPARAAGATWPDFGPFRDTILRYQEILQSAPAEPL